MSTKTSRPRGRAGSGPGGRAGRAPARSARVRQARAVNEQVPEVDDLVDDDEPTTDVGDTDE